MFSNPIFVYIGFAAALIAALGGVIYPDYAAVAWGIAGFFGFGSLAAIRQFIEARGWKTYALGGITALAGILTAFKIVPIETYQAWLGIAAMLGGVTITQGLSKAKAA